MGVLSPQEKCIFRAALEQLCLLFFVYLLKREIRRQAMDYHIHWTTGMSLG